MHALIVAGGQANNMGENSLNSMPQQNTGSGQPHTNNFSDWAKNGLKNILSILPGNKQQSNQQSTNSLS